MDFRPANGANSNTVRSKHERVYHKKSVDKQPPKYPSTDGYEIHLCHSRGESPFAQSYFFFLFPFLPNFSSNFADNFPTTNFSARFAATPLTTPILDDR